MLALLVSLALTSCREAMDPYTPDGGGDNGGGTAQTDTVRMFPSQFDYPDHLDYIFNSGTLSRIILDFSVEEWNKLLSYYDRNPDNEEYVKAKFTFYQDGKIETVDTVGVRLRGNTSRRRPEGSNGQTHKSSGADWHHAHFSIDFDKYNDDQRFHKLKKLDLKWFKDDPTYVHEPFCYDLMKRCGISTEPLSAYSRLTISVAGDAKSAYFGIYDMIEHLDKRYLNDRESLWGDSEGYLWKASWGATLKDPNASMGIEEIELDNSKSKKYTYNLKTNEENLAAAKLQLSTFITTFNAKTGDDFTTWLESRCDVSFLLATYAASVAVGHWDDYWNNCNNYYIYFNSKGRFYFIPYDLDNTIGTSLMMDSGRQDPLHWGDDSKNQLIAKLLTFDKYKKQYIRYMKALVNPENGLMDYTASTARIHAMQAMIVSSVSNDTGEDEAVEDKPASWGNHSEYRLIDPSVATNFFKVKASIINAL
jgi:spore coat protein CotH